MSGSIESIPDPPAAAAGPAGNRISVDPRPGVARLSPYRHTTAGDIERAVAAPRWHVR